MSELIDKVLASFGFEEKLAADIRSLGRLKKAKAGDLVIGPETSSTEMPIVLSGLLRVMRREPNGKEVFLYFLEGGETCAMSITCCLEGRKTAFNVVAEEDATLWMVPMAHLDSWVSRYQSFRRFVFNSYQIRFDELLQSIDSIAFLKMDERIWKYLLDKKQATGSFSLHTTHEQIAKELNTSRVVVSRLLKQLEREDKIEQHRNRIEIL